MSNEEASVTLTSTVLEALGDLCLTSLEEEELEENEKGGRGNETSRAS